MIFKKKAPRRPEEKPELPSTEQIREELERERYRTRYRRALMSTAFTMLVVAAVAALLAVLVLPVLRISGTSMTDTLQDGDIVVAVNGSRYKTGDVVAFYYNNSVLIKRVIATSGDWVDIDANGNVFVNGQELEEPYVSGKALGECDIELPYQVPDGKSFVMGDHRETSVDSRHSAVGCIDRSLTIGRILFRVWPLDAIGPVS